MLVAPFLKLPPWIQIRTGSFFLDCLEVVTST
jgi:hypothetical protein